MESRLNQTEQTKREVEARLGAVEAELEKRE